MKIFICTLIGILTTALLSFGQTTVSFNPEKDAMIRSYNGTGDNTNYGTYPLNNIHAWTNSGNDVVHRSLLSFDLSSIPSTALIQSADLTLYSDPNSTVYPNGHEYAGGSNACLVQAVTSTWTETGITWNNQPTTTSNSEVIIPASTSSFQNYSLDVTALVQNMVSSPGTYDGFMIKLQDETSYRRMAFASIDNADPLLYPELVITYINTAGLTVPLSISASIYPNPCKNQVVLEFDKEDQFEISVFDPVGKLIQKNVVFGSETTIELIDLQPGQYSITVSDGTSINTFRFLKKE